MPLTSEQLKYIELIIGYEFKDKTLLKIASDPKLNQNFETGGDGVLDVIVYGAEFVRVVSKKYLYSDYCEIASNFFHIEHLQNLCHQSTNLAKVVRCFLYPEHQDKKHGLVKAGNIVEAILCAVLIDIGDAGHHTHAFIQSIAESVLNAPSMSDEEIETVVEMYSSPTAALPRVEKVSMIFYDSLRSYGHGKEFSCDPLLDRDIKYCMERIGEGLLKYSLARVQNQEHETLEWFEYWRKTLERDIEFKLRLAEKFIFGKFKSPSILSYSELEGLESSDLKLELAEEFVASGFIDYYQQYARSLIMMQNEIQERASISSKRMTCQFRLKIEEKFIDCYQKHEDQLRYHVAAHHRVVTPHFAHRKMRHGNTLEGVRPEPHLFNMPTDYKNEQKAECVLS